MSRTDTAPVRRPLVVFVDIDDTLVRSFGRKRLPMTAVLNHVRELKRAGAELYAWSSAGADYAQITAAELGVEDCFTAYLPKPNVFIDDQRVADWRASIEVHPNSCSSRSIDEYRIEIETHASRGLP